MTFDPSLLQYCGNDGCLAVFYYNGVKITASVSARGGVRSIAVGLRAQLPNTVLAGLLSWFGMDMHRSVNAVRYMDDSRCFIQLAA